jgi:hypothetical protein
LEVHGSKWLTLGSSWGLKVVYPKNKNLKDKKYRVQSLRGFLVFNPILNFKKFVMSPISIWFKVKSIDKLVK